MQPTIVTERWLPSWKHKRVLYCVMWICDILCF